MAGHEATGSTAVDLMTVAHRSHPDGNSSAVIQRAIDRASLLGGAIVELSAARWFLDRPVVLKDNVELRGVGAGTYLKASLSFLESQGPHGGHPLITTDGAENVTIRGLVADQSAEILDANVARGRLKEYLIDIRYSRNVVVKQVQTTNPFTYSSAVVGSECVCISNSRTTVTTSGKYDQLRGIHVLGSSFGRISGNWVDQGAGADGDDGMAAHTMGEAVHDITYEGNVIRGGRHGAGLQFALDNEPIYSIAVLDNTFWGSPVGIHTGYYGGRAPLDNLVITGNKFVDIPGHATDLFGRLAGIAVTNNKLCRSGDIKIGVGRRNYARGNRISRRSR